MHYYLLLVILIALIRITISLQSVKETITLDTQFSLTYQTFSRNSGIDAVRFTMTAKYQGYLALGIGSSMSDSDMMIGLFVAGSAKIEDRVSKSVKTLPALDSQQDLTVVPGKSSRTSDTTTITFERLLDTGDLEDKPLKFDTEIPIIYAWGSTDYFEQHIGYGYGKLKIKSSLINNNVIPPSNWARVMGDDYVVYWDFNDIDQSVDIMIKYNWKGWFGIGFGRGMYNVDMIYGNVDNNNQMMIYDTFSTGETSPDIDKINNVFLLGYTISNTQTVVKFNRKLNTGDGQDAVLTENSAPIFCMAYTNDNTIRTHQKSTSRNFQIQFKRGFTGEAVIIETSAWQEFHNVVLFFGWGILTDFAIIFARHLRHLPYYIEVHTVFFFLLDLITLISESALIHQYQQKLGDLSQVDTGISVHYIIGVIFLVVLIFEQIGGLFLKFTIEGKIKAFDKIPSTKKFHQVVGIILYVLAKFEVLVGTILKAEAEGQSPTQFTAAIIIFVILLVISIILELLKKLNKNNQKKFLAQRKILQINMTADEKKLINMINKGIPTSAIIKELPQLKWMMLNRSIFNVSDIFHPAGNYMLDACVGREIGRFFYGSYCLESDTIDPYNHSYSSLGLLYQNYLGEIPLGDNSILASPSGEVLTDNKLSILMDQLPQWTISEVQELSQSTSVFYFHNQQVRTRNWLKGVEWIGRHFTIKHGGENTQFNQLRLYTTVVYFTRSNMKYRSDLIKAIDQIKIGQGAINLIPDFQTVENLSPTLPFAIKCYDFPETLTQFLFENQKEPYIIEGPMGSGLELKPESTGKHVFFAGGTGILPFLDLLDFLFKKAVLKLTKQKNLQAQDLVDPHGCGYEQSFNDPGFSVEVHWAILNKEEFTEGEFFRKLSEYTKLAKIPLRVVVRSGSAFDLGPDIETTQERFDAKYVQQIFKVQDINSKVFICGPPSMNLTLPKYIGEVKVAPENIMIV